MSIKIGIGKLRIGTGGSQSLPTYTSEDWYGIQIDETAETPDQTRIAGTDKMGYHATLPVHSDIKACLLNDDGTVNYYLDPTDWTKKVGGAASNLDGTDGQVMLEYPDFYFKVEMNTPSAGKHQIKISQYPITGFKRVFKHYVSAYEAAASRSTTKLASVINTGTDYRGGDNTSAWDAADNSLLGKPVTKLKNEEYRAYARLRGINWDMFGYNDYTWIVWLFVIEYATLNSQKTIDATLTAEGYKQGGLGLGVEGQNLTNWNTFNAYNPFIPCGHSNSLGTGTGAVNYTVPGWGITVPVNRYRGLELPFGHIWKNLQGALVEDLIAGSGGTTKLFINDDHATWNGSSLLDYLVQGDVLRATSNYVSKTLLGTNASINGTSSTGGTAAKYYCDQLFSSLPTTDSIRIISQGCYAGATTGNVGLFSVIYTSTDSANGSVSRGTRLSYRGDLGFTRLADMTYVDAQHCLVAYNGKLYNFGGINKKYESYDPATNVWTDLGDMPIGFAGQAYRQSSIAELVGTKIYHIGGLNGSAIGNVSNEVWEYTPATDAWVQKTNMPTAREDFGAAVVGTKIYCFGGVTNVGGVSTASNVLEIYDTATDTWDETKTDMPEPRALGNFAGVYNGKIYLIGGVNTMVGYPTLAAQTIVWEYDPVADTYTVKSPIPFGTCYKYVDEINGKLYVISGAGSGLTTVADNHSCAVHEYDVVTDTWTRKKGGPYAVLGCSSAVLNGKIYWCGGSLLSGAADAIKALIRFDTFYDA